MRLLSVLCLCLCAGLFTLAACGDGGGGDSGTPGTPGLLISPPGLPGGVQGQPYSVMLSVSGSSGPFTWGLSAGALPAGITLDTATTGEQCELAGTPQAAGTFLFTVSVSDGTLATARAYQLTVQAPAGLAVSTVTLPPATVLAPYNFTLQATGAQGPLDWSLVAGVLPPGLSFSAAGQIAGTPTVTGNWGFTAHVSDGVDTAERDLVLPVQGVPGNPQLENQLRNMIQMQGGVAPLGPQHLPNLSPAQVELGRLLFFDKALSGNGDVACATCHHPTLDTGDGLNLSIGVGATGGIGPGRDHPLKVFIARNAQPIYNLHLFPELFWDKRVGIPPGPQPPGPPPPTQTPEGPMNLPPDAAQALFPLTDLLEMRGSGHALDGLNNADYRQALVNRLAQFPEYVNRFDAAFGAGGMTVPNMARAIAVYERSQTYIDAPWDRYLRGDPNALTDAQKRGARTFIMRGQCVNCHSGPLLTNFSVHNIGVPQFGPGKGNGPSGREDFGFENTVNDPQRRYEFRVPSLRNVAYTGPYMHNGAFSTLAEVLLHYRDKAANTAAYTGTGMLQGADLAPTLLPWQDVTANLSPVFQNVPSDFTAQELADLEAFLHALTDPAAINRRQEIPVAVPSGLPVDR